MLVRDSKEDPLIWLYKTPKENIESIIKTVDSIVLKLGYEIRLLVLSSIYNLFEILETRKFKYYQYKKKKLGENIYSYILKKRIKGTAKTRISKFIIFKHQKPNIYILLTHASFKVLRDDIISLIRRFYPKIAETYIDSFYMKEILKNLERKIDGMEIRIIRISSQGRIRSKGAKKKFESDVKWTDLSYEEAFERIEEYDNWIRSIYFNIIKNNTSNTSELINQPEIICQIARNGMIKCNQKFSLFYDTVVKDIITKALGDLELFIDRERSLKENFVPKPIKIHYKYDLFKDKSQNNRLIDALKKITYSSLSVIHYNPYLHCTFVDFKDGSSYDIWILSNNEIIIIPQMRSSYASLERLCNHIFIGLREGIIENYSLSS